jgi:hypothetical protein
MPIIIVIISGLFALFGGFFGALLTRRTEYKKWLRQERSVAFAEFLKQLNTASIEAIEVIFSPDFDKGQSDQKITNIFCRLNGPENVVRLYLEENDREKFSRLLSDYWELHFQSVKMELRVTKGKEIRERIQAIFEKTLHY